MKGVEGCGKGGEGKTVHAEEIERGEGRVARKRDLRRDVLDCLFIGSDGLRDLL